MKFIWNYMFFPRELQVTKVNDFLFCNLPISVDVRRLDTDCPCWLRCTRPDGYWYSFTCTCCSSYNQVL